MPVRYHRDVREDRMEAVVDAIDVGTPGSVEIGTDATGAFGTVLATIALDKPSFDVTATGDPVTGPVQMVMEGVPKSGTAVATNTAAHARIKDGAGKIIVDGLTVGVGATFEINLNSAAISSGQTVTLSSGTITHG